MNTCIKPGSLVTHQHSDMGALACGIYPGRGTHFNNPLAFWFYDDDVALLVTTVTIAGGENVCMLIMNNTIGWCSCDSVVALT